MENAGTRRPKMINTETRRLKMINTGRRGPKSVEARTDLADMFDEKVLRK